MNFSSAGQRPWGVNWTLSMNPAIQIAPDTTQLERELVFQKLKLNFSLQFLQKGSKVVTVDSSSTVCQRRSHSRAIRSFSPVERF